MQFYENMQVSYTARAKGDVPSDGAAEMGLFFKTGQMQRLLFSLVKFWYFFDISFILLRLFVYTFFKLYSLVRNMLS